MAEDRASKHSSDASGKDEAVYHEVSTTVTNVTRITGAATVIMVALAFIFCFIKGRSNKTLYLLPCNLIISSFVGIVNAWWYRRGTLGADKYWFILTVCSVIIFQCLATDIFVFNFGTSNANITTAAPTTVQTTTHS